jgi:FMN phosphatase YigB (HAD superfamily)
MKDSLEPLAQKPDAVLFDLDDTLYAYSPAHAAGIIAARQHCEAKIGLDPAAFDARFAEARDDVNARLSGTAASHHRLLYFQRLVESATGKSDAALSLELEKVYWRRFMATARLFPGARVLIEQLRYAKIPTALVTDLMAQIQMRKIVYFELEHAFDAVVTSEEAGAEKPDPRIFELAVEKLGLAGKSARIWMIGESAEKDIAGAREALGAVTLQKLHHGVEPSDLADVQFRVFSALADGLQRLFRSGSSHA